MFRIILSRAPVGFFGVLGVFFVYDIHFHSPMVHKLAIRDQCELLVVVPENIVRRIHLNLNRFFFSETKQQIEYRILQV